jgi:antitoxin component YwqK of YwqJK toxin-antitoxin module
MQDTCYVCSDQETKNNKFIDAKVCLCKGTIKMHWTCYYELLKQSAKCSICNITYLMNLGTIDKLTGKDFKIYNFNNIDNDLFVSRRTLIKYLMDMNMFDKSLYLIHTVSQRKFYSSEGKLMIEAEFINDIPNGKWKSFYDSGILKEKGTFDNGLKHGYWKTYYDRSGYIKSEGNYNHGKQTGTWKEYHESNGKLEMECIYINDRKEGIYKKYFPSGSIESEGTYMPVTKSWSIQNQSIQYEYYDSLGKIKKITKWKGVIRKEKNYNLDGSVRIEIWYSLAVRGSPRAVYAKFYHKCGKLRSKGPLKELSNKIKTHGHWKYYYESGALKEEGPYVNGLAEGHWKYYYESGALQKEGPYVNGLAEGHWKYYYESGALQKEGPRLNSSAEGHWKYYYESGALKEEGPRLNSSAEGHWKYYYESGALKEEGLYTNGDKTGKWIKYSYSEY